MLPSPPVPVRMAAPPRAGRTAGRRALGAGRAGRCQGAALALGAEKGVRLVQKLQVGSCIPAGTQLEKAEGGPISTWGLSHLHAVRGPGLDDPPGAVRAQGDVAGEVHLGSGRIAVLQIEALNLLANLE